MDDCIKDWGIKNLLCITVDNTNANDTTIKWLKRNTIVIEDIVRGSAFNLVWYTAHILNLIYSG